MTFAAVAGPGIWYPSWVAAMTDTINGGGDQGYFGAAGVVTGVMDATGEKVAMIGRVWMEGRPTTAKTFSSAGGKVHFPLYNRTFSTAGSTVRVSMQDVATGAGPPARPDETADVFADLVQGTDTLNTGATWNTKAMSSGSKSVSHGDLIAIVFDFTTRNGSDSLTFSSIYLGSQYRNPPLVVQKTGGTWAANPTAIDPVIVLEFDDGTLAIFDQVPITSTSASSVHQPQDSTNPDEYGLIFQVPWNCKIDAVMPGIATNQAAGDCDVKLYSDPLGTPSAMVTISYLAEQGSAGSIHKGWPITLPTEIELEANTDYCLAVKATNTGQIKVSYIDVPNANYRKFYSGGTTLRQGSRNNSTGAFTELTTRLVQGSVRISQFHVDGGGAGGTTIITPRRGHLLRI